MAAARRLLPVRAAGSLGPGAEAAGRARGAAGGGTPDLLVITSMQESAMLRRTQRSHGNVPEHLLQIASRAKV